MRVFDQPPLWSLQRAESRKVVEPRTRGQSDHEEHPEVDLGFTEQEFNRSHRPHLKFLYIKLLIPSHSINTSPTLRV